MNARKIFIVFCMTDVSIASDTGNKSIINSRTFKLPASNEGKQYNDFWYTVKDATREASRLAKLEPTKLFVVLESVRYFETTTPDVIEKEINANGEFVLKSGEARRA